MNVATQYEEDLKARFAEAQAKSRDLESEVSAALRANGRPSADLLRDAEAAEQALRALQEECDRHAAAIRGEAK